MSDAPEQRAPERGGEHAHAAAGGRAGQLDTSGLRPGWTTGACATAAALAATRALFEGEAPDPVTIRLPRGHTPAFALTRHTAGTDDRGPWAMAAVTKDAGDDPDVTHLAVVEVTVRPGAPGAGVTFVAGEGVGTVTLPGLPLPVGEPAINPVPRRLITEHLTAAAQEARRAADLEVTIGVVDGRRIAEHTWNPRLGILGGLSILGTTGVVVPYSCAAWIDSIHRGIDVARALGHPHVAGCTGSTSERVVQAEYDLPETSLLDMGDFAGAVLKHLRRHPVPRLTICGGFAKLSKLAAGHLDLHSGRSRVDLSHLADLAGDVGAGPALRERIRVANTGLEALHLCQEEGVPLGDAVARAAARAAADVLGEAPVDVDVVCIDRAGEIVGRGRP